MQPGRFVGQHVAGCLFTDCLHLVEERVVRTLNGTVSEALESLKRDREIIGVTKVVR
jgi:hypothetical protein